MSYQMYERQRRAPRNEPMISILKHGVISINKMCYERFFKGHGYVVLFYDPEAKRVGIRPLREPVPQAYPIRITKGQKQATITGIGFLKHFGLVPTESKSYRATWSESEELVEIQLEA